MNEKEFVAEMARRLNALRINFRLTQKGIRAFIGQNKFDIYVLSPIVGDDRKCLVRLYHKYGTNPGNFKWEKPVTSYYLTQYITGHVIE